MEEFFKELNIELSQDSEILLLGIYSRKQKTYVDTKMCVQMFIAAFFLMAQKFKQSKHVSTDE